jgi:lysophospholipase L1-like esterase
LETILLDFKNSLVFLFLFFSVNAITKEPFLAVFGDSIALGVGTKVESSKLDQCLELKTKRKVLNLGYDGLTSSGALNKIKQVLSASPEVVLISLGGNDVRNLVLRNKTQYTEEFTLKNIRTLFKKLKNKGIKVVHLGLDPEISENAGKKVDPVAAGLLKNSGRLKKIKEIAKEEGVFFIEKSMAGLWGNPELMSDLIHPNDKGYAVICDKVYQFLVSEKLTLLHK